MGRFGCKGVTGRDLMEKAILEKRRTGGESKYENDKLWKKGQKEWEGGFGFNGLMGGT